MLRKAQHDAVDETRIRNGAHCGPEKRFTLMQVQNEIHGLLLEQGIGDEFKVMRSCAAGRENTLPLQSED